MTVEYNDIAPARGGNAAISIVDKCGHEEKLLAIIPYDELDGCPPAALVARFAAAVESLGTGDIPAVQIKATGRTWNPYFAKF